MADSKTPAGTVPLPDNPELANLKEREAMLVAKLDKLGKSDANHWARQNFDLNDAKNRVNLQLAEIRSAMEALK